jgi:hypothetical protein
MTVLGTAEWLLTGSVTQLVLAIISKDTRIPLERWVFDIKLVDSPSNSAEPYVLPQLSLYSASHSPEHRQNLKPKSRQRYEPS